jgi:hypothetical protein
VYLTDEELAQLRRTAARMRISLSRHIKERIAPDQESSEGLAPAASGAAGTEVVRLMEGVRKAAVERADRLAENLRTVMVMLDQLVLAMLTHLPDLPESQRQQRGASGTARHREWQRQVETILRELRAEPGTDQRVAGNGASA